MENPKVHGIVRVKQKKIFKITYILYEAKKQERLYEAWDAGDAMDGITRDMEKELEGPYNFIEVQCLEEDVDAKLINGKKEKEN